MILGVNVNAKAIDAPHKLLYEIQAAVRQYAITAAQQALKHGQCIFDARRIDDFFVQFVGKKSHCVLTLESTKISVDHFDLRRNRASECTVAARTSSALILADEGIMLNALRLTCGLRRVCAGGGVGDMEILPEAL